MWARERERYPIGNPRKEIRLVDKQDGRGVIVDCTHRGREVGGAVAMARAGNRREKVAEADQPEDRPR